MREREIFYERHPDPMWIYDLETLRFLDVNLAAEVAYGYTRAEFLALDITAIRPPEDVPLVLERVALAGKGRTGPGVWRHLKKSGEILYAQITAHAVDWNGRRAELVSVRDVTHSVRIEQERDDLLQKESAMRRSAEAAAAQLAAQNATLRTAQRLIRMGIWKYYPQTDVLIWSPDILEMYGVTEAEFGGDFASYVELVHPDDREEMERNYTAFVSSEAPVFEFAHRILRPDGKIIHIRGVGELTLTPEGVVITGVVQDITPEVARDNQLHLLEQSISRLNDVVLIFEAGGEAGGTLAPIVYVNPSFLRITGLAPEDVLGQPIARVMTETAPGVPLQVLTDALRRPVSLRSDIRLFARSGRIVPAEIDLVPVKGLSGQLTHWVAVIRDMSEKHAAEARARTNEERYELLSRSTHDVVWDWDFRLGQISWNENFRDLAGNPSIPLIDLPESWIGRLHPDDRDRVLAGFFAAAEGDGGTWNDEYRFLRDDGDVRYIIDRGFIIRDVSGKVERMVGSMVDITSQKKAEARLLQAEKLEALGQITGGVAHDFNNLLMIILGNTETLLDEAEEGRRKRLLELVFSAAERGRDLTGRLLAFARRIPLKSVNLDLNETVARTAELMHRTFRSNVRIEMNLGLEDASVENDPAQLELVIFNLAVNARDAMKDGGVITFETHAQVEAGRRYVALSVTDTGAGMDSETLRRCLEPFFTTKPVGEGVGLGLSMAFGFMAQTGGKLLIDSAPGKGTRVTLLFPYAKGVRPADAPPRGAEPAGRGELVLLIEDEPGVRDHVMRLLVELGYRVFACANADEAIDYLMAGGGADLILSDLIMPGDTDVRDVVRVAAEKLSQVRVLYSSGYPKEIIARDGRLTGDLDMLPKPYRRAELAAKLREMLDRAPAGQAGEA